MESPLTRLQRVVAVFSQRHPTVVALLADTRAAPLLRRAVQGLKEGDEVSAWCYCFWKLSVPAAWGAPRQLYSPTTCCLLELLAFFHRR